MTPVSSFRLGELVAPLPAAKFLSHIYGRTYRLFRGSADRFSQLLTWPSLNELLQYRQIEYPRLRLVADGVPVPPHKYEIRIRDRRGGHRPWLRVDDVNSALRSGATLSISDIQELHPPIGEASRALEGQLRERVSANAYLSFGTKRGFRIHRDPHDVFVAQVVGRKEWRIYIPHGGPSSEVADDDAGPAATFDECIVNQGDLLYLPRGWWHSATPIGEPTLHLAFGVTRRTGLDLLEWLGQADECKRVLGRGLPRYADPETRIQHLREIRDSLLEALTLETLERFFDAQDGAATASAVFSLPRVTDASRSSTLDDGDTIYIVPPRAVLGPPGRTLDLLADGRRWTFDAAVRPVLQFLLPRRPAQVRHLIAMLEESGICKEDARELLMDLLRAGLIAVARA